MKQFKLPDDVHWIAPERTTNRHPIETTYFKTIFNLAAPLSKANINISANDRYILYVNGKEVIRGPCRGDHWHQYCDMLDIAPYLQVGHNIIAAKVTAYVPFEATNEERSNYGPIWVMSNSAGPLLIVQGEFDGVDISTGQADWFYCNDTAISWNLQYAAFWMGCTEDVDGKALPHGWENDKSFDGFSPVKAKWNNQVRYGEIPSLFLYERPIKYLLRDKISVHGCHSYTEIPANDSREILLDAKQLTTAFVYLRTKGGTGSVISLLYSEAFSKMDGNRRYKEVRSDTSGELVGVTDIYHPAGGDESYSPSWLRTFRFIRITITTGLEPLTLLPLEFIESRYPLENKISFEAVKQPWIKDVWKMSQRTLELCMHESYEDCPFYEQLQYTMDTRLQMLFTYIISGDSSMQLKAIHDFHTSMLPEGILQSRFPSKYPQVIPVFSLHWIFMLKDYYIESGDKSLLERYRPTMESVLAWYKRKTGAQGLVEHLGYWDFADWTDAWDDINGMSRASLHGPSTIQNLVYAFALDAGAYIMDVLELASLSNNYISERKVILEKVNSLCWSEEKGLYRDGPSYEEYSQHSQIWAVLNGIAVDDRAKNIMQSVLSDKSLVPCSFVMQYYLFRALEKADMYAETEGLWTLWKELLDLDLSTIPEIPGKYTRSDCHAWGALLLHELPRKFLGVEPLTAGYEKILIRPIALYVGEISGEVPTPKGSIRIKWSIEGGRFTVEGNTPVPAELILPDGTRYEVAGDFSFDCGLTYTQR